VIEKYLKMTESKTTEVKKPEKRNENVNYDLVINSVNGEITIALLREKQLVEIHKEKGNAHFAVGDIYLGKVKKVMTGLNAAFVDVGYEKDAFFTLSGFRTTSLFSNEIHQIG